VGKDVCGVRRDDGGHHYKAGRQQRCYHGGDARLQARWAGMGSPPSWRVFTTTPLPPPPVTWHGGGTWTTLLPKPSSLAPLSYCSILMVLTSFMLVY